MSNTPNIDFLLQYLEPDSPERSSVDWDEVEREIGLSLPSDYKALFPYEGRIFLGDLINIISPALLKEEGEWYLDDAKTLREEDPETAPYPLFPEPRGVFPWAVSTNNDVLWWRTLGEPDEWTVIAQARDSRPEDWWPYELSATEFLAKLMTREIQCPVFPDFPTT